MDIVVCVKQVPDASDIKMNDGDFTLVRDGVATSISLMDKNALELALKLREKNGGKIHIVSMGTAGAKSAIQEAIAMGADAGLQITDPALKGSDAVATAYVLSKAIKSKFPSCQLVLLGRQSFDGSTGLVAPALAEFLGLPSVTNVFNCVSVGGGKAIVERTMDSGSAKLEVQLPAVISCEKSLNEPRYPSIKGTMKAKRTRIPVVTAKALGVEAGKAGLSSAAARVIRCEKPAPRGKGEILSGGSPQALAKALVGKLQEQKIV